MLTPPEIAAVIVWDSAIAAGNGGWKNSRTYAEDSQVGIDK